MRLAILLVPCVIALSGCADIGALAGCTTLATFANTRSSDIRGTVNGQYVRGDVTWSAQRGDPGYVGIDECYATVIREKQAKGGPHD